MQQEPILIDEEKLLTLKEVSLPLDQTSFHYQALFLPFNSAFKKYVSLDKKAFLELLNSLPDKVHPKEEDFLDRKFEELLNLPVEISRKEVNQVTQKDSSSHVESLERNIDQNDMLDIQSELSDNIPKFRQFTINFLPSNTYPSNPIMLPPVVSPAPGAPTTPNITIDSQFTGGLNTEVLLNTQQSVSLTGNIFHEGATGGIRINAYFAQPARPGASENRAFPDKVILTTPEGNTLTFYTASTQENWIGDFIYELNHALPHLLNTPGLDVTLVGGHKIFTEHFLYSITNEFNNSNVGKIDVQIIDDIPIANNQLGSVILTEADIQAIGSNQSNSVPTLTGNLLSAPNLAINRIGADGGTVFDIALPNNSGTVVATQTTLTVTTNQGNTMVVNRLTGAYTYTLNNPFDNSLDPNTTNLQAQEIFTYEFLDNDGDSATATLTITILDDKPIATVKLNNADETALFVNSSEIVSGNLITDDDGFGVSLLGADGASLTKVNNTAPVNGIINAATTYGSIQVYASAQNGHAVGDYSYSLDGTKTVLANDALGQVLDTISYELTDGDTSSIASSQLKVTVTLNQAPTANDDTGNTNEDTVLSVNAVNGVLANDTDPNMGDTKIVSAVNGAANAVGAVITLPSGATLQLNANGSYNYDPRVAFNYLAVGASASDNINYTMHDAEGLASTAQLSITITGVNDAPTAVNDSNTTHGTTVINVNSTLDPNALLANDTDPDIGDTLTIIKVNNIGANVGNQFTLPSGALLTVNADGTYQYDPNGQFAATGSDSFTYTISDGHGGTSTATVNISVIVPPIVFDLNDDGINLIPLENSQIVWQFPCGNYHLTGWVGPEDGLLVYDFNKDGKITLLEEFSFVLYHPDAKTDLEGLRLAFDTNQDGIFDNQDALFSQFGIWQDKNSNGITDEGELLSLIDKGITALSLQTNEVLQFEAGNVIFGSTQYQTSDGLSHLAADVGLMVGPIIHHEEPQAVFA
ncbi:MAG: cadherin-like domain-containing protein [Proteobacteria bacterium]|nr:cadherin-like domain-containing protein [Pseudomonadota bacterium]